MLHARCESFFWSCWAGQLSKDSTWKSVIDVELLSLKVSACQQWWRNKQLPFSGGVEHSSLSMKTSVGQLCHDHVICLPHHYTAVRISNYRYTGSRLQQMQGSTPKRFRMRPMIIMLCDQNREWKLEVQRSCNFAQEITAVAAAGAKVQFDRISVEESAKFRKTALSVAKAQNFANCVALIKEVAVHYGFALCIETGNYSWDLLWVCTHSWLSITLSRLGM